MADGAFIAGRDIFSWAGNRCAAISAQYKIHGSVSRMLQEEQYASRCFFHANCSAQRRPRYRKIDAEALATGLPSKDSVHWLKNLVVSLFNCLLEETIYV